MAEASQSTVPWSNEDRYVSRMNLRYEKHLKRQLNILEHERHMTTKSLQAEKRNFEDRVHRLNMDPSDRAHLSKDTHNMIQADKNKELDRLLKSLMHRPYETRAGYSYIKYLTKNMEPLVKRPLQWGINPKPSPKRRTMLQSDDLHSPRNEPKPRLFLTQIEGQPVSLTHRTSIPVRQRERSHLVLPPIASTISLSRRQEKPAPTPSRRWPSPPKEHTTIPNQQSKSREIGHRKIKKESKKNVVKESVKRISPQPDEETKNSSKVFVAMATLKVPSPTFPSRIHDLAGQEEEDEEVEVPSTEPKSESQSRANYALSWLSHHLKGRRKSI